MKCHNCAKEALFGTGPSQAIPLCLDCYGKFTTIWDRQQENLERYQNYLAEEIENSVGLSGYVVPRFPPRPPRTVLQGDVTLHNIKVSNSNVGVLNTGSIGSIDTAIGLMKSEGMLDAAGAFAKLTDAIAASTLDASAKNRALEEVSLLASEASAPIEKRRSFAMKPLLLDLSTLLGGAASLGQLWALVQPVIAGLFP